MKGKIVNENKLIGLVIDTQEYKDFVFSELHGHKMRKPVKKGWFESQADFNARLVVWEMKNNNLIDKFIDYFKIEFPDIYADSGYELVSYGFTAGSPKTFIAYIRKVNG